MLGLGLGIGIGDAGRAIQTPQNNLGSLYVAEYTAASLQQSAGIVTAWNDVSGGAQHLSPTGSPTYNASDAITTPAGPTVSLNGTTQFFSRAAFALGASATGFFAMCVCRPTANGGWVAVWAPTYIQLLTIGDHVAGQFSMSNADTGGASSSTTTGPYLNTLQSAYGYGDLASGAGNRSIVGVSSGTPVSTSGTTTDTQGKTGNLNVGGTGAFFAGKMVALVIANGLPSQSQINNLARFYGQTYGTP